ncbi:MAG TPA: serine hydrolase [Beijerinckiaceae bacterium]|jgi:CubicO group peptidase (beta-lactamase class C family)
MRTGPGRWGIPFLAAILLGGAALAQAPATTTAEPVACGAPAARDDGWPITAPAEQGLDPGLLCGLVARLEAPDRPNLHGVLVARHGRLVFEHYAAGEDERWARPLGRVEHGPDILHDQRSVSKSVTALLVGIAVGRGVLDVEAPVTGFFPEYADLRTPERDRILVRHLLTMSPGLAWEEEQRPYGAPLNSAAVMARSPEPYRFVLEQPVVAPPGAQYNYNSGATALLGKIVSKAVDAPLEEFARTALFEPLGIAAFEWGRLRNGDAGAAWGLRLRPRDMAKIGQLVLNEGAWNGRQVVPAAWVREMTAPRITGQGTFLYGYQWWLGRSFANGRELRWAAAVGLGGQRIFVVPDLKLVAVVTAGLYASRTQMSATLAVLNQAILPAAKPSE